MTIEEIVAELDELIRAIENDEYGVGEVLVELRDLVERIRPPEVKFRELYCGEMLAHQEHLWVMLETKYYCPGREVQ